VSRTVPVVATVVVVLLAGVVYSTIRNSSPQLGESTSGNANFESGAQLNSASQNTNTNTSSNPVDAFSDSSLDSSSATVAEKPTTDNTEQSEIALSATSSAASGETLSFAQTLAREYVDDETLLKNAEVLKKDPALLAAVLDEFLAETDEERLGRLRLLLGQLDDPSLVGVAETMVYSGNAASADAGLTLLRDISADVPAARTVALDVLSSTQDPDLLLSATQVMAAEGLNDSEIAPRVVASMTSLVQHSDARVRRSSYATLARWSDDPSVTPTLLQGLTDANPAVRRSTAYGLVGYAHADASVVAALMQVAENTSDTRRVRRSAVTLDESQSARLEAAQNNLN